MYSLISGVFGNSGVWGELGWMSVLAPLAVWHPGLSRHLCHLLPGSRESCASVLGLLLPDVPAWWNLLSSSNGVYSSREKEGAIFRAAVSLYCFLRCSLMELVVPCGWLLEAAGQFMVTCWGMQLQPECCSPVTAVLCWGRDTSPSLPGFCPPGAPLQPCSPPKSAGRNVWLQQVLAHAKPLSAKIFAFCCSAPLEQISSHHLYYWKM